MHAYPFPLLGERNERMGKKYQAGYSLYTGGTAKDEKYHKVKHQ